MKILQTLLIVFFFITNTIPVFADEPLVLPQAGTPIAITSQFAPPIIRGINIYPNNPLQIDFIVDTGDNHLQGEQLKEESRKLIKYFMAALTIPKTEMWVNLSPYEKDRIIADGLGQTQLGRDMLAQDYILKQLTSSLMYPEKRIGNAFWKRVYKRAQQLYGTTQIPIDTFNKIWIIPDKASVLVNGTKVFVVDSHLKVMLEADYLALRKNVTAAKKAGNVAADAVRTILVPEIEKEVNEGKNFASLRQIYNSMILAVWYKKNLQQSLLGHLYVDQNKIQGVDLQDKKAKELIYQMYLKAYKKGVYNYIKEDYDEASQTMVPRKYFSGGLALNETNVSERAAASVGFIEANRARNFVSERVTFENVGNGDNSMTTAQKYIEYLRQAPEERKNFVLIVGTGPAGLRAGDLLLQKGYKVVYFEQNATFTGLAGYGIPAVGKQEDLKNNIFALGTRVIAGQLEKGNKRAEIGIFSDKVKMFFNTRIGNGISMADLEALDIPVIVATGAQKPRIVDAPGKELRQIISATSTHFRKVNIDWLNKQPEINNGLKYEGQPWHYENEVMVFGGGNVASDAILSAARNVPASPDRKLTLVYRGPLWAMANMSPNYFKYIEDANANIQIIGLRSVAGYLDEDHKGAIDHVQLRVSRVTGLKLDKEGKPQILMSGITSKPMLLPKGKTMLELVRADGGDIPPELNAQLEPNFVYQVNVAETPEIEVHPVKLMIEAIGDEVEPLEGLNLTKKGAFEADSNTGRVAGRKIWVAGQAITQRGTVADSFKSAKQVVDNIAAVDRAQVGGIDFNEDYLNMTVVGNPVKFNALNNIKGDTIYVSGFRPVIKDISAVSDFASLLK